MSRVFISKPFNYNIGFCKYCKLRSAHLWPGLVGPHPIFLSGRNFFAHSRCLLWGHNSNDYDMNNDDNNDDDDDNIADSSKVSDNDNYDQCTK